MGCECWGLDILPEDRLHEPPVLLGHDLILQEARIKEQKKIAAAEGGAGAGRGGVILAGAVGGGRGGARHAPPATAKATAKATATAAYL